MTILPAALAVGIIRLAGLVHRPTPPPSSPAAGLCRIVPTAVPVLAVLSAWSTFNAIAETSTYTNHKADNSIEARIASARDQASGWEAFLDDQREGDLHIAAWGNGRGRGWANGGGFVKWSPYGPVGPVPASLLVRRPHDPRTPQPGSDPPRTRQPWRDR